jgi:hypothetical protein
VLPSSNFALRIRFSKPSGPYRRRSFPIGVNPTKYYGDTVSADLPAVAAHARHGAPWGRSTLKTRLFLISARRVSLPIMVAIPPRSSHAHVGMAWPPRVEDHNTSVHTLGIRQLAMPQASGFGISDQENIEVIYSRQFIAIKAGEFASQNAAQSCAKLTHGCL